jgi:uncharacterized protein YjbJ (UPF0337 family)
MSTGTENTLKGKFDEVAGKVKQSVGEAINNDKVANEGTAQQVKGHAEQAWGSVQESAHGKAADIKANHEADHNNKAHDVRESITSTAQNVKEKIQNALHSHDDNK